MRNTAKLVVTALAAAAVLAAAVGTASATHLSTSNPNFRVVWTPLAFTEGGFFSFEVRCNVTMEGSFTASTIAKTIGSVVGDVTRAIAAHPCTGGEGWAWNGTESFTLTGHERTSLPWHLTYEGFTGTLPNINGIRILLVRPKFTIRNAICLGTYQPANQKGIINRRVETGTTTITPETETSTAIEGTCPEGSFANTSNTVTGQGTATAITVTLI